MVRDGGPQCVPRPDEARRRDARLSDRLGRSARGSDVVEPDWDAIDAGTALRLLGALSDEQRAALVLFHLHDQPIAAVADQLERSVRATESLLVRARQRLRALVEEDRRA